MSVEYTLSIIKPNATAANVTGAINAMIEKAGLRIVAQKRVRLSRQQALDFYREHEARPFYQDLVTFMISGPVVLQVLEGKDAVATHRTVMGATNPEVAEEGTIRRVFGESIEANAVHGSDSAASASREVQFFFTREEIVG